MTFERGMTAWCISYDIPCRSSFVSVITRKGIKHAPFGHLPHGKRASNAVHLMPFCFLPDILLTVSGLRNAVLLMAGQ
ncbi:MAG: hypothetical protein IJ421_03950 [Prevotella sp.]|nr:hypothetical protein [Prevotella sp.]